MEAVDLNFGGNMDFGLFGWTPHNTIPYYYWTWDADAEKYKYARTLQVRRRARKPGRLSPNIDPEKLGPNIFTTTISRIKLARFT